MTDPIACARDGLAMLRPRLLSFIDLRKDGSRDDVYRDKLIGEALTYQMLLGGPYRCLCDARAHMRDREEFPALPTDVFRFSRVAGHPPEADQRVFRTSGTTSGERGVHPIADLTPYDEAARTAARYALFPDERPMRIVAALPSTAELPDSSLSYMVDRFFDWFGDAHSRARRAHVLSGALAVDVRALVHELESAITDGVPAALLGTSFGLVHLDDALGERRFALPAGSRVMQTGGFKGKSREVSPAAMRSMLSARYGVPDCMVVQEYGMTELCSQMYTLSARAALLGSPLATPPTDREPLWVPGWVRATPVDPDTLLPVANGEVGLLRIDDLANLGSVCAIQTSDRALVTQEGLLLLGRAPGAVPRGCSLAVEEALDRRTLVP